MFLFDYILTLTVVLYFTHISDAQFTTHGVAKYGDGENKRNARHKPWNGAGRTSG